MDVPILAHSRVLAHGFDLERVVERVSELMDMSPEEVLGSGNGRRMVEARSLLCYWAIDLLGTTQTQLAQILRLTQPAISQAVSRGRRLADIREYSLVGQNNL